MADETGDRLPAHGPLKSWMLPDEPHWREVRNESLRAHPADWFRWDDAVAAVAQGRTAVARPQYVLNLGNDHPIVQYLASHLRAPVPLEYQMLDPHEVAQGMGVPTEGPTNDPTREKK